MFQTLLFVRDHLLDSSFISDVGVAALAQTPLALCSLFVEDMVFVRARALDLSGFREAEALLRPTMRFDFNLWHSLNVLLSSSQTAPHYARLSAGIRLRLAVPSLCPQPLFRAAPAAGIYC
jgi:hypothetical protein